MDLEQVIIPALAIMLIAWVIIIMVLYFMVYLSSNILDDKEKWGPGLQVRAFIPIVKQTNNKKLNRIIRVHYVLLKTLYLTIILIVLIGTGITIFKL